MDPIIINTGKTEKKKMIKVVMMFDDGTANVIDNPNDAEIWNNDMNSIVELAYSHGIELAELKHRIVKVLTSTDNGITYEDIGEKDDEGN